MKLEIDIIDNHRFKQIVYSIIDADYKYIKYGHLSYKTPFKRGYKKYFL